jgi:hypothetical protein
VDNWERLLVDPPREQDLGTTGLLERDRAAEALGGLRFEAMFAAIEANVGGLG